MRESSLTIKPFIGWGILGTGAIARSFVRDLMLLSDARVVAVGFGCADLVTRRVGLLWGIANIATLIGLIGTIFGLIDSFAAQAMASPEQKAVLLTRGIAHAMNNTAWGLSIAVTCIVFHMVLSGLTKNVVESLDFGAVRTTNILAKRFVKPGAGPASQAPAATAGA